MEGRGVKVEFTTECTVGWCLVGSVLYIELYLICPHFDDLKLFSFNFKTFFFCISKMSVLHAVKLLRMMDFNREVPGKLTVTIVL